MTNKINGIDVSECSFCLECEGKQKCATGFGVICDCEDLYNCYFKQLKRLQKENEKLKKLKCKFKEYCTCDIEKYRSALEEINKWATNHNPCDIDPEIKCTKEDCFQCLNYDITKITKIINEVLNDN